MSDRKQELHRQLEQVAKDLSEEALDALIKYAAHLSDTSKQSPVLPGQPEVEDTKRDNIAVLVSSSGSQESGGAHSTDVFGIKNKMDSFKEILQRKDIQLRLVLSVVLHILALACACNASEEAAVTFVMLAVIAEVLCAFSGIKDMMSMRRGSLGDRLDLKGMRKLFFADQVHMVFFVLSLIWFVCGAMILNFEIKRWQTYMEIAADVLPEGSWWCWTEGPQNATHVSTSRDSCLETCPSKPESFGTDTFGCVQVNDQVAGGHWLLVLTALHGFMPLVYWLGGIATAKPLHKYTIVPNLFWMWCTGWTGLYATDICAHAANLICSGPFTPDGPGPEDGEFRKRTYNVTAMALILLLVTTITYFLQRRIFKHMAHYVKEKNRVSVVSSAAQGACDDAIKSVQHLERKFPTDGQFVAPSKLPCAHLLTDLLNNIAALIDQEAICKQTLQAGLTYMHEYMAVAEKRFSKQGLETLSRGDKADTFVQFYNKAHDSIKVMEKAAYENYQNIVLTFKKKVIQYPQTLDNIGDPVERIFALYTSARRLKDHFFNSLIVSINVGKHIIAPLKGCFRVLEKEVLRPGGGVPWDIVRAQIICDTMEDVTNALQAVANAPGVVLFAINDRFSDPKGGWADCSLYLSSTDPLFQSCVAEIQIVHQTMMLVREGCHAHDVYDECRFAAELLMKWHKEKPATVPWSQQ